MTNLNVWMNVDNLVSTFPLSTFECFCTRRIAIRRHWRQSNATLFEGDCVHVFCYTRLISYKSDIVFVRNHPGTAEYMYTVTLRACSYEPENAEIVTRAT